MRHHAPFREALEAEAPAPVRAALRQIAKFVAAHSPLERLQALDGQPGLFPESKRQIRQDIELLHLAQTASSCSLQSVMGSLAKTREDFPKCAELLMPLYQQYRQEGSVDRRLEKKIVHALAEQIHPTVHALRERYAEKVVAGKMGPELEEEFQRDVRISELMGHRRRWLSRSPMEPIIDYQLLRTKSAYHREAYSMNRLEEFAFSVAAMTPESHLGLALLRRGEERKSDAEWGQDLLQTPIRMLAARMGEKLDGLIAPSPHARGYQEVLGRWDSCEDFYGEREGYFSGSLRTVLELGIDHAHKHDLSEAAHGNRKAVQDWLEANPEAGRKAAQRALSSGEALQTPTFETFRSYLNYGVASVFDGAPTRLQPGDCAGMERSSGPVSAPGAGASKERR